MRDRSEPHTHSPSDDYGQFSQPEPGEGGWVRRGEIMVLPTMLEQIRRPAQLHSNLNHSAAKRTLAGEPDKIIRTRVCQSCRPRLNGPTLWPDRCKPSRRDARPLRMVPIRRQLLIQHDSVQMRVCLDRTAQVSRSSFHSASVERISR